MVGPIGAGCLCNHLVASPGRPGYHATVGLHIGTRSRETLMPSATDRIEKKIVINAPRARVWRAISDSKEFSAWFLSDFDGPFAPGAHLRAKVRYPGYEHVSFE